MATRHEQEPRKRAAAKKLARRKSPAASPPGATTVAGPAVLRGAWRELPAAAAAAQVPAPAQLPARAPSPAGKSLPARVASEPEQQSTAAETSLLDGLARGASFALGAALELLRDVLSSTTVDEIDAEVRERIARAPMELNAYGFDPWGFNADTARKALIVSTLLYRYYFRVETFGIENVPAGRVLLIANHAGQVAIDAVMIGTACLMEADPPRIVRGMGEYWLPTLPVLNVLMTRVGSVVGTPKNCVDLLEHGEAVIAFPEGVRGMNKSWSERYRLQAFGLGFLRLALQTSTPILPIAVVGSEEQAPSLGNFKPLARLLGMPAFPLVLTPVPLPVRYRIHFGKPMEFGGSANDEDEVIARKVDQVKARIREMIERGLRERPGVFR